MKPEYVVYGLIFVIAGIAFIFFSNTSEQLLNYGVYVVIIIGLLFSLYGAFTTKKQTYEYPKNDTFSPPERYNEKCLHLVTTRKPTRNMPKNMDSDGLTRYFCSAMRDQYGEPRPIDRCIKNCPDFKS